MDPKHSHPDIGPTHPIDWEEHGHVGGVETGQAFKRTLEADFTERVDTSTSGVVYIGQALPGSTEAAEAWKIVKITLGSEIAMQWPNGETSFTNSWDDRGTLTYV